LAEIATVVGKHVCEDPLADPLGDLFGWWGRGERHGVRLQSHKSSYKFSPRTPRDRARRRAICGTVPP